MRGICSISIFLLILLFITTLAESADQFEYQIGAGIGPDITSMGLGLSLGLQGTVYPKSGPGFRAEISWARYLEPQGILDPGEYQSSSDLTWEDAGRLRTISVSALLLDKEPSWGISYFIFRVGVVDLQNDHLTRSGLVFGPGMGVAIGDKYPNLSFEILTQLAIGHDWNVMQIPIRVVFSY